MWLGIVCAVVPLAACIVIYVVGDRMVRAAPKPDWLSPRSPREALARLVVLAMFYFWFAFVIVVGWDSVTTTRSDATMPEPYGAIVIVGFLVTMVGILALQFMALRRRPRGLRRSFIGQLSGAETTMGIFLPSRLAEAGHIIGVRRAVVWSVLGGLLATDLSLFLALTVVAPH